MKTLFIDAVKTIISCDSDYTFETRALNKELADYLVTRSEHIIIVTNAFGNKYKRIRELLSDYDFDTFTLENRPPKTDPAYFDHLLSYYGRDPEQCFYLDHKPENLAAAAELGITWELFLDTKQAIEVLKAL